MFSVLRAMSNVLLLLFIISVPVVFSFGLIANADTSGALYFFPEKEAFFRNWTASFEGEEPPQGYYAILRYSQFASDGFLTFAFYQVTQHIIDFSMKKGSKVVLNDLRVPTTRRFVDFVTHPTSVFEHTKQNGTEYDPVTNNILKNKSTSTSEHQTVLDVSGHADFLGSVAE
jgi:hypothetical protein